MTLIMGVGYPVDAYEGTGIYDCESPGLAKGFTGLAEVFAFGVFAFQSVILIFLVLKKRRFHLLFVTSVLFTVLSVKSIEAKKTEVNIALERIEAPHSPCHSWWEYNR